MADDARVVQGIDWRRTFPFTHIFRSFRIAIHPSKLLLALLGLVLLYVGGRVLDGVWRHFAHESQAHYEVTTLGTSDEIRVYENTYTRSEYKLQVDELHDRRGLFATFFEYEIAQIDGVVKSVRDGRWVGRGGERENPLAGAESAYGLPPDALSSQFARARALAAGQGSGLNGRGESVVQSLRNFVVTGPTWAITYHPVYFTIFGLWFLVIWSIFGGAIARIAAIHVARDEKLSIRQALRFSVGKLLSFLFAPVIPIVIVLVVGIVVAVVALIGDVPFIGPIIIGALFFLALAAGFVMTLVMLGTIGGFNLMYPTIAVEGSDSFDAISRSFSYLYARPWRMAFYSLVAIVYGALCYLFVRLFIWLMLALTHFFVNMGMFTHAGHDSSKDLFDTMWTSPVAAGRLVYNVDWSALNWGEAVGAGLICFWVYLVIAMLGAFAISFYFSANTVIYYLMRQEVDATELDDVYVEQSEEDFGDATIPGSSPAPATVTTASVETTSGLNASTNPSGSSDSSNPPPTT